MSIQSSLERLKDRVAIVTGASSGLGRATAVALAEAGVRIVAVARRAERLQELKDELAAQGRLCAIVAGDAADPKTAAAAVAAAGEFGRIDILVNNAGLGNYKSLVETTVEEYDELMNSNMRSSFVFTRAVAPHLIEQRSGAVVFVSSVAGLAGAANEAAYCASKFAQVGFAQAVDEELRPYGVKVCALCPGGIKTEFAVGRGRKAEDVAKSVMMEARDAADAIVFACMQPEDVRIPQMTVRHMGVRK
ncbi:MAG TPA: SDR family oxidoreductase [Terracidiphilus sp.]|nr:SDR family oxidoreductase [Terracidiphilus sp.]